MDSRSKFVLKNSKEKFIRLMKFYEKIYNQEFTREILKKKYNDYLNLQPSQKKLEVELDFFYDIINDSFDFIGDIIIIFITRLEKFIQEFQLFKFANEKECKSLNEFIIEYSKTKELENSFKLISTYLVINNYKKHGLGKSMDKVLLNGNKLSYYSKNHKFKLEEYIFSDSKNILDIDMKDIQELYNCIIKIMDFLIEESK